MTDFLTTYRLTRQRFDDAIRAFPEEHLHRRIAPDTLTTAEMAMHVAGAEVYVLHGLLQKEPTEHERRLIGCAFNGVVNSDPFPFTEQEMTTDFLLATLESSRAYTESVLAAIDDDLRKRQIKSVLGPMIDGDGAFARLCSHPFYHQGQVYLIHQLLK